MKKKIFWGIGLLFVLLAFPSCNAEDEINSYESGNQFSDSNKSLIDPITQKSTSVEADESSCSDPVERTIYAGQHMEVGKLEVSNSIDHLYVTYDVSSQNGTLKEIHLFVGDKDDIPFNKSGNPMIGHFPYSVTSDSNSEYTFKIPLSELEDCFVIVAHSVVSFEKDGKSYTETAFAHGNHEFDGKRWGWYLDYCQQECDEDNTNNSDDDQTDSDNSDNNNDGNSGNNNDGNDPTNDCLSSYAYNESNSAKSSCFLNEGFDQWGWTNILNLDPNGEYVGGLTYSYPLIASAYQCDISNSMEVGYIEITIQGGDGVLYADVHFVVTDSNYDLSQMALYFGESKFPSDDSGSITLDDSYFNYRAENLSGKTYALTNLEWSFDTYFIAQASICPVTN